MSKGNILLVEDDPSLGFVTKDQIEAAGYKVVLATDGEAGWKLFLNRGFDLCLLDVMLPNMDGFELARKIRAKNEFVPIIFITARDMSEDKWKGFEIGGDDYLTKPFSTKELLYRIAVFMRRRGTNSSEPKKLQLGTYDFDMGNLELVIGSEKVQLTEMEGAILKLLCAKQGKLVKREEILIDVWGENDYFKGRSLDVFISRLRKYLRHDEQLAIKNHHGVGFTLTLAH